MVLESAAENGVLVKIRRKFDWGHIMKYPKRQCLPKVQRRMRPKRNRQRQKCTK